jgi:hypothetical protein
MNILICLLLDQFYEAKKTAVLGRKFKKIS